MRAAEAAEAAGAQEKFWEMHDELFTHQQALEDHDLSRYAGHIGLDGERFAREMAENTFLKQIDSNYDRSLFDEQGEPTKEFRNCRPRLKKARCRVRSGKGIHPREGRSCFLRTMKHHSQTENELHY